MRKYWSSLLPETRLLWLPWHDAVLMLSFSPVLLWPLSSSFCRLKASNLIRRSLDSFQLVQHLLGSTMCSKLCQVPGGRVISHMWSGAYVPVGAADTHLDSLVMSTLKGKRTALGEHQSRAPDSSLSCSRFAGPHNFHVLTTSQNCLAISMKQALGVNCQEILLWVSFLQY